LAEADAWWRGKIKNPRIGLPLPPWLAGASPFGINAGKGHSEAEARRSRGRAFFGLGKADAG